MATFEELYRQHVQAVFRFALSVAGKREVAEDLTSEAFLALHRNLAAIDQSQLPGWLLTVVRNRARDWWRATKRRCTSLPPIHSYRGNASCTKPDRVCRE